MDAIWCSALDKIFPTSPCRATQISAASMPRNGRCSWQAAVRVTADEPFQTQVTFSLSHNLPADILVYQVQCVPCRLASLPEQRDVLQAAPGFFPDVLQPLEAPVFSCIPGQWTSLWLMVEGCDAPGDYEVRLTLRHGEEEAQLLLPLQVLPLALPPLTLHATQWLHQDCIAQQHRVTMFSEAHWSILEQYLRMAVRFGMDTVLTPIFTPPLDTEIGSYRMACQLTDVTWDGTSYRFGFSRLRRWIQLCRQCGIRQFELSHLFTQWGAKAAPQILVRSSGVEQRRFGWDTPAQSQDYQSFLRQFLPALYAFLETEGVAGDCLLHISDEPEEAHLADYSRCVSMIRAYLPRCRIIDAVSNYAVYEKSGIDMPVAPLDQIAPFVAHQTPNLWGYYCWVQYRGHSNRFFSMPAAVTRIFGIQAYLFRLQGFLHWGFNFYNARLSRRPIDPYQITDADGAFPGGDAFSVYPTGQGCIPSLRLAVFADGLEDYRALSLLEARQGRAAAEALIADTLGTVTWTEYPRDPAAYLQFRRALYRCLLS